MRFLAINLALFLFSINVFAQEDVLFSGVSETGGFGGPAVKVTTIFGHTAVMVGGRGGWIINHSLMLGGGAYGVVNEIDGPNGAMPLEGPVDIKLEYFGFEGEYIMEPMSMTHYGYYLFLGLGALHYMKDGTDRQVDETDLVYVAEPGLNGEINLTSWMRISAGVSYRILAGVNMPGLRNEDFTGLTGSLTVKFGNF